MNTYSPITTIELPYSKEEMILQMEIDKLFSLIETKKKEKAELSVKKTNNFLIDNIDIADFHLADIVYNVNTHELFIVDSLNPFHVSIF